MVYVQSGNALYYETNPDMSQIIGPVILFRNGKSKVFELYCIPVVYSYDCDQTFKLQHNQNILRKCSCVLRFFPPYFYTWSPLTRDYLEE